MNDSGNSSSRPAAEALRSTPPQPVDTVEKAAQKNARPAWVRFLQRMGIYFAIYVFSLGPMYWQWWEGKYLNGSRLVAAFYEPLLLLCGWIPPLGWFVNSYVHIWVFDLRWAV